MNNSAQARTQANSQLAWLVPIAALLMANLCFAMGPYLVRTAGAESGIGPIAAGFWRMALAVPILAVIVFWKERGADLVTPGNLKLLLMAGAIFAADLACWHIGITQTKLGNASLLGNSASVFLPVVAFLAARQWPSPSTATALCLAVFGAFAIMGQSAGFESRYLAGDILSLLAGVLYTAFLIVIGKLTRIMRPWTILLGTTVAAAPVLLVLALAAGESIVPENWIAAASLAVTSQVAGQALLIFALGRTSATAIGVSLLVQPAISVILGWTVFGEVLGALDAIGSIAICVAMVLVARNHHRDPEI